jgi:hypothetical protein
VAAKSSSLVKEKGMKKEYVSTVSRYVNTYQINACDAFHELVLFTYGVTSGLQLKQ